MVFFHHGISCADADELALAAEADWPLEPAAQPTSASALADNTEAKVLRVMFIRGFIFVRLHFCARGMPVARLLSVAASIAERNSRCNREQLKQLTNRIALCD